MLRFREYVKAESLEEAYEKNQKKSARVIGGMLWLKMQNRTIQTAIDLSGLGLDTIEETKEEFRIGCMVTLRQLELSECLNVFTDGAMASCVKPIVGVQFRNLATVGGSIFGRFGFSDVLTLFLALDSYVELYRGGVISMAEFAAMEPDRDILVRIIVKKTPGRVVCLSHRNTKTDFPVLTCAVRLAEDGRNLAVFGATPARAKTYPVSEEWLQKFTGADEEKKKVMAAEFVSQVPTGSNIRAGAEYRSHLAAVLFRRGLTELMEKGGSRS